MKATVLIDNLACETSPYERRIQPEWGLSILIQEGGHTVLLDTGASDGFARNAETMGIDLSQVEATVLSHAHYDHSGGLDAFLQANDHAPFWLREGGGETCYSLEEGGMRYIGIPEGFLGLADSLGRTRWASGTVEILPGFWLVGHSTPDLGAIGQRANMYLRTDGVAPKPGAGHNVGAPGTRTDPADIDLDYDPAAYIPDDFRHEQSLVVETAEGLVIFNSCSHGGADAIIQEVARTFPEKPLCAMIGGFHLFRMPEPEIVALADRMRATGIAHVFTGHCTGDEAFKILQRELSDAADVQQTFAGMVFEF